ncbi:MAG TPA: hypothetical protein VNU68_31260 [Verrucomicrobiae bacterium]|nr:hypothetical protein [Verrucomicrobiae bacterium]
MNEPLKGLAAIREAVAKPVLIKFQYNGQDCEMEARHLTPHEAEMLKLQIDEIMPPIIKGKTEAEDRFDYTNKDYLQRKTRVEHEVRAQAIFWACPDFKKAAEDAKHEWAAAAYEPKARLEVVKFVQGLLVDEALEVIYNTIIRPAINLPQQVNLS